MKTSPTQNYQIFEECLKNQSHLCIIVALSKTSFDSRTLRKPVHYLESLNPRYYIQLHMLASQSYIAKRTHGSLTAVLITRKHRFCDRTHSERDPTWQTTSALNKPKGKPVSLPSALVTSQKASSEM